MKVNKKIFRVTIFSVIIVICISVIINTLFLFNPLTYSRDKLITEPYTHYRKPITYIIKTNDKTKELYKMQDSAKFIYKELDKSEVLGSISDKKQFNIEEKGQLYIKSYGYGIVTKIRWFGKDSDVCSTMIYFKKDNFGYEAIVKITPELKEHLNNIFID